MPTPTLPPTRRSHTYLPDSESRDDIIDFAKTMRELELYLTQGSMKAALVAPDGTERLIPDEIFRALEQVANALANGSGVTVAPMSTRLTTQEAADFLGISRPTLVKLLDGGEIAHEKRGRHRRVTLRDLVKYQERTRMERREALGAAARAGQRDNPGGRPVPALQRLDEE